MTRKRAARALALGGTAQQWLSSWQSAPAPAAKLRRRSKNGGTLVIGLAEDPDALDPTLARTFVGRIVFLHMCEKLYDLNSKLQIVPQLAAALPQISKDKLTYTIKLRSGIKFNDGTAFNAAAVKASLDRHLTLKGSTRASEISPIASVDASGANTVVLHLKAPFSPLTAQLADRAGMIMSPKALDALGDKFATEPGLRRPVHVQGPRRGRPHHARQVERTTTTRRRSTWPRSCSGSSPTRTRARRTSARVTSRCSTASQSTDVPTLQKDKSRSA